MARRHQANKDQLSSQDLVELRKQLAEMSRSTLDNFYKATHNACAYAIRLPPPSMIQELVQAWKELRRRGSGR